MSQTPNKTQKYATKSCVWKSSTPVTNGSAKHSTISLSGIDTVSSSSDGNIGRKLQPWITKKRKKSSKSKRTKKNMRMVFQLRDTDSEWETNSEELISEPSGRTSEGATSKECNDYSINLFKGLCSPEKTREALKDHELLCQSPIIRSSRKMRSISIKDDIAPREESVKLPVVELLSLNIRDINAEDMDSSSQDELIFHRKKDMKTYPSYKEKEQKNKKTKQNSMDGGFYLSPIRSIDTRSSDLLWDEFVAKNHDDVAQYLAPLSARAPIEPTELTDFQRRFSNIFGKLKSDPFLPNIVRTRGCSNRISRRWITYTEQYDGDEEEEEKLKGNDRKTRTHKRSKRTKKMMAL